MTDNKHTVCPNCQTSFDKNYKYCPECGQENKELKLDLKYFLAEWMSAVFNLDSKIFRTLKLLFLKPGKLTAEFISGRRNSYIQPVRLYLVGSFIFFTISALVDNITSPSGTQADNEPIISINTEDSIQAPGGTDAIFSIEEKDTSFLEKITLEKTKKLNSKHGLNDLKEKFTNFIPIGMFFFIPLTAWLLFILFRRKKYYVEHLVFVLHFQTLIYLVFTIMGIAEILYSGDKALNLYGVVFIGLVLIWIRKYYDLGWGKTIWKTFLFLLMYSVMLIAFFVVIVLVSFYTL